MGVIDFAALTRPVSASEPCGADLDLAGDPGYLNFMASAEGLLPASYFEFDRAAVDFGGEFDRIRALLAATRDVRLLITLAKLLILNGDLSGFSATIAAIAALLQDHWGELHPRVVDGDALPRTAPLFSLDDLPSVVLPLQYAPLVESRRHGWISFRSHMVATSEVKARPGEQNVDAGVIEKALEEVELASLVATRDRVAELRSSLKRIRDVTVERAGYEQAVSLEKLPELVARMLAFLDGAVARRDPSAALAGQTAGAAADGATSDEAGESTAVPAAAPAVRGRVRSVADAAHALAAIAGYFGRSEPSSPALLLIRQAEQLIGKSFYEVMQILVPARVEHAVVSIGADQPFTLPLGRLSSLAGSGAAAAAGAGDAADGAAERIGDVATRRDAIGLLEDVGAFYRSVEPSSPIPLLTDRARSLVERDFLHLLKDLLPEAPPPPAKK